MDKLRELKEIKHFDVNVDVKGGSDLSLSITCNICGSRCLLSHKNEHILISNWTRHVSKCVEKARKPISSSKIEYFFLPKIETQKCLVLSHHHLFHNSSSEDESFKTAKNEQSLATPCGDNKASSNIDQVSATETSYLQRTLMSLYI